MRKQSAKEYLYQLWNLDREISIKNQELEKLHSQIGIKPQPDPDQNTGGRSGNTSDPVADMAVKIVKLEDQIYSKIVKLLDLQSRITDQIDNMENRTFRDILTCRYVLMQNWEQVAETVGYERRQCLRLHGRALQEFERKYLRCH